ncbi:MAG: hemolysin family protein [Candidatus Kapaibacterium sp.]
MIYDILLTLFFVALNGFFVAAEFAIVKVRHTQIEMRAMAGSWIAGITRHMINHLDAYLSATQLGITLASLGLGWIGESVVANIILNFMHFLGVSISPAAAHSIALPLAFATITVLHIVFGELAPKSFAIQRSVQVSLLISIPLRLFYIVFKPFIWMLNSFANKFIGLFGFSPATEESELHTAEELRYILKESQQRGVIDTTEHKLLENIFEFSKTPVRQIMVPRNQIFAIDLSDPVDEIISHFIEDGFSRMPVFTDSIDNIIGVIYAKDMISMMHNENLIILQDIIRPPFFVNEDTRISRLLQDMQRNRVHLAIVLDEFGGTAGIVTLEDVLEEIVGEIQDEYDEETPLVVRLSDGEYSVKAMAAIDDVNEYLPVDLPEDEDYETLGGLITSEVGRIPEKNEIIHLDDYDIKIVERSKRSIKTVLMRYIEDRNGNHDKQ